MTIFIDPDCLACVTCYRVIAAVGTGQGHLVQGGKGGVCCDECVTPDQVKGKLAAVCSLCGYELAHLSDTAEMAAHLSEAHGMHFDPRPLPGSCACHGGRRCLCIVKCAARGCRGVLHGADGKPIPDQD